MRLLTIISLIILFAVSQYARQFNYLECTLANTFKTMAVKCDCETIATAAQADEDKTLPQAKVHFHPSLDQFFTAAPLLITENVFVNFSTTTYSSLSTYMPSGYCGNTYRPPRIS